MSADEKSSVPTRASLLGRLANWEDTDSWAEFRSIYSPMIQRTARRAGLNNSEAQDVEQETLLRVARTIHDFNPNGGNFKAWLLNQVRWRIGDHYRARGAEETLRHHRLNPAEGETATEERIAADAQLERIWDEEWQQSLLERAVARISRHANPKHAQIFDLCLLRGQSPLEVSRALGVSLMTVFLVKTRLGKELKKEVERLREAESK